MKLGDLAARLGCTVDGDGDIDVTRVTTLEDAGPGDITFFANTKYADALKRTRASAVIAAPSVAGIPCAVVRATEKAIVAAGLPLFRRDVMLVLPSVRTVKGTHDTETKSGALIRVGEARLR